MTMLKTELVNQKAKHMRNVKECQRNEIVGGKKDKRHGRYVVSEAV